MRRLGAVLAIVTACGGTQEPPARPAGWAPNAERAPVVLGARRHPGEEPNADEDRNPVVRQPRQATPGCSCERK